MRKRDDRIFFIRYENQMAALVRDYTRTSLELGAMNAYQRLLVHRCADQFQLAHLLDRTTNCITLSKTPATSHPAALLSIRAREVLVQRHEVDRVTVHPAVAGLAASSAAEASNSNSPCSSASASPTTAPAAVLSPSSNAPKPGFQIMRRDTSKGRQSPLRSTDTDSTDPNRAAANVRKDMTLEEREASYRAARARIFGDTAVTNTSSGSASPTASTPPLDAAKVVEQALGAASASSRAVEGRAGSPGSSAASSVVASPAPGRANLRAKKASGSSSSAATQDGSAHRVRGKTKAKATAAHDSTHDDLEFSRAALPISSLPAFGAPPQQASTVGVWAQQVQNNAALRPPPSQQQQQKAYLAYPPEQQQQHLQPAYPSSQPSFPLYYAPMPTQQQHVHGLAPSSDYAASRSAGSSRASSQRGAQNDAVSVSSSRSASFSGSSTAAAQQGNGGSGIGNGKQPITALAHPSLPARPAWLPSAGGGGGGGGASAAAAAAPDGERSEY